MKTRKRPVVTETVIFSGFYGKDRGFNEGPKWLEGAIYIGKKIESFDVPGKLIAHAIRGPTYAIPGDYITKGVNSELYPCRPGIFEKTYEIIE